MTNLEHTKKVLKELLLASVQLPIWFAVAFLIVRIIFLFSGQMFAVGFGMFLLAFIYLWGVMMLVISLSYYFGESEEKTEETKETPAE